MLRATDDAKPIEKTSAPVITPARSTLRALSTTDIQAELRRREQRLPKLASRRDTLLSELAQLEQEISVLEAESVTNGKQAEAAPASRPSVQPRPKTRTKLGDAIASLVELHAFVVPKEALYLLKESGYPMTKSLPTRVAGTLATDERFSRVERGTYERVR